VEWWKFRPAKDSKKWRLQADQIESMLSIYPVIRSIWMLLSWIALLSVYGNWAVHVNSSWHCYIGLTVAMLYHPCIKMVGVTLWFLLYKTYADDRLDGKYRVSSFYNRAILAVTTKMNGVADVVNNGIIIGIGIAIYPVGICLFVPVLLCILGAGLIIALPFYYCWSMRTTEGHLWVHFFSTILAIMLVVCWWIGAVTAISFVERNGYLSSLRYGFYGQYCDYKDKQSTKVIWNTENMDWRHWVLVIGWFLF